MRRALAALVLAISALVVAPITAGPVAARTTVGAFDGEFVGEMLMDPGIPLQSGCRTGSYTLTGRLAVQRARSVSNTITTVTVGADQLNVTVVGTTDNCLAQGNGSAFMTCSTASALGADVVVPEGANDVLEPTATTCNLSGTMTRTGAVVAFALAGNITVTDPSTGSARIMALGLNVAVALAPTFVAPCGVGVQCITDALAAGGAAFAGYEAPPVTSTRAGNGAAVYKASATLDRFPCPPPSGGGPCGGSLTGDWHGSVAGTWGDAAYNVTWSAPGSISATFSYAEWQCLAGLETILGFASGDGVASAAPGEIQGKWQVPGESFARDIIGVSAQFHFVWTRAATGSVITFEPASMTVDVAGLGTRLLGTGPQYGAATFAATHTDPINGPPLCSSPISHVEGQIAGTVTLTQAAV